MVYKKARKGSQGIGTLIIFIALILVAAVAAGVLISTVGKLQGKAETTGTQVQQKLGTGFSVFEVIAYNTNDSFINNNTDNISVSLQLSPGSDAVKLNDVTLTLVTSSGSFTYSYNSTVTTGSDTIFTNKQFGVQWIKGPTLKDYISKDDTVKFNIVSASPSIGENEEFTIRLFPGSGNPLPIQIITPPAMINRYTILK